MNEKCFEALRYDSIGEQSLKDAEAYFKFARIIYGNFQNFAIVFSRE